MNIAVEVFKILATVSDHRPRECSDRFRRYFDRARSEKLIVRNHEAIICRFRRFAQTFLLFDEADIAAAFQPGGLDFLDVLSGGG